MANKPKYTISRTDEVSSRDCTCSCHLPVTVYFSLKEKEGHTFSGRAEPAEVRIIELT
jgi:hypothetical protein